MEVDKKLLENVVNEAKRLSSQLKDLEEYKSEMDESEYNSLKSDTLNQIIANTQLLEKLNTGDLKASSEADSAKLKLAELIVENYNVKEILNTYLSKEVVYLRANLKKLQNQQSIGKISNEQYQQELIQLLEAIAKVSELNDEEKSLNDNLKNKVISTNFSKDEGVDKYNIENKFKK